MFIYLYFLQAWRLQSKPVSVFTLFWYWGATLIRTFLRIIHRMVVYPRSVITRISTTPWTQYLYFTHTLELDFGSPMKPVLWGRCGTCGCCPLQAQINILCPVINNWTFSLIDTLPFNTPRHPWTRLITNLQLFEFEWLNLTDKIL